MGRILSVVLLGLLSAVRPAGAVDSLSVFVLASGGVQETFRKDHAKAYAEINPWISMRIREPNDLALGAGFGTEMWRGEQIDYQLVKVSYKGIVGLEAGPQGTGDADGAKFRLWLSYSLLAVQLEYSRFDRLPSRWSIGTSVSLPLFASLANGGLFFLVPIPRVGGVARVGESWIPVVE